MELIVLSRRRRIQRALHLGSGAVALSVLAFAGLIATAFWTGYRHAPVAAPDPRPDLVVASIRQQVEHQQRDVDSALAASRRDLDALALTLSELQARSIRLDALGARLVELAGLDNREFGFGKPPARGGPAPGAEASPNRVTDFVAALSGLGAELEDRGQELAALEVSLLSGRLAAEMQPTGRPLLSGWISSTFGRRSDPMTGQSSMHYGVDFAGRRGSAVRSVAAGVVVFSGARRGFGRVVDIDHGRGYVTRYAHNRKNLVKMGERVAKGQQIAELGSSGRSTGDHVHFEVLHDGRPLDPMQFIRAAAEEADGS